MLPLTEATVREALRDCYDPVIPCNIVDLGAVQTITVTLDPGAPGAGIPGVPPKYSVAIDLVPTTTSDDPGQALLPGLIANRLAGIETIYRTSVRLLDDPVWTPQRITPRGRHTLGLDGNPHLVQITPRLVV